MKRIIQLFTCLFIFMLLFQIVGNTSLFTALLTATVFAIFMSVVLGFLHIQSGGHEPVQEESWDVPLSYEETFRQCREAGVELKKAEIKEEREEDGFIKVHTGVSWKSWGDEVIFRFQNTTPDKTRIAVTSRPRLKVTFLDYGKNYENIRHIGSSLKREI